MPHAGLTYGRTCRRSHRCMYNKGLSSPMIGWSPLMDLVRQANNLGGLAGWVILLWLRYCRGSRKETSMDLQVGALHGRRWSCSELHTQPREQEAKVSR